MGDLVSGRFDERLKSRLGETRHILAAMGVAELVVAKVLRDCRAAAKFLAPYITDTIPLLHAAAQRKEQILFEGAQGTLLDIDYGTYPFVTSSNTTAGGACTGAGFPPNRIDRVIGVVKAYTTRVGEGPFPTELLDATGEHIRTKGHEFGATTGRPRRCGWFDGLVAHYSVMINGINEWALTKLDVLDEQATIKVCVAYKLGRRRLKHFPADLRVLAECEPVYEEIEGWQTPTAGITRFRDLPPKARAYVRYLERLTGVQVGILSTGPARDATIWMGGFGK